MMGDFLFLSLICCIPSCLIFVLRKDLQGVMFVTGICAIPFAFTESLFYPSYWEPKFIWDLADKIGFGIEDLIFVCGLGALTSSAYAFAFKKKFVLTGCSNWKLTVIRLISIILITGLLVYIAYIVNIPMIYGAIIVMFIISAVIILFRKDLLIPSLAGGVVTCITYAFICFVFSMVFKDVFHIVWHGEKFSGVFVAGILLEEYLYGFAAGITGTVFYPFLSNSKYA
ncbi:MAG: hypothetical protein GXY77_14110 [Fibrobacter sp.]|nr:hypothetical protein [Fibrobacter sp.]